MTTAPKTATTRLLKSKWKNTSRPVKSLYRNPPMKAPATPRSMVMMHPPGSRPGMSSFAITPAINPKMIQLKIPKTFSLTSAAEPLRCSSGVPPACTPVRVAESDDNRLLESTLPLGTLLSPLIALVLVAHLGFSGVSSRRSGRTARSTEPRLSCSRSRAPRRTPKTSLYTPLSCFWNTQCYPKRCMTSDTPALPYCSTSVSNPPSCRSL